MSLDPIIASIKTITPTTLQAAGRLKDALSLLDHQIRTVWKGHKEQVDALSLEDKAVWNKKDWRSWKRETIEIWHKNCWSQIKIMKYLSNDPQVERAEFFDYLKSRCNLMDETGKLGNKLRVILDSLFAGDGERKIKARKTRQINEQAAQKRAEIDAREEARKIENISTAKKQKLEVQTFAARAGITEQQAAWIKSFASAKH